MLDILFLFFLALIWITFAVIQDMRKREIANWLNFSLIIFALGFRFFYSLFSEIGLSFFYQGLIGFVIFLILGNLLYYARVFAGGDAKLMIAFGSVLPFSSSLLTNLKFFLIFFVIFLVVGAGYSFTSSLVLSFKHFKKFKKEFGNQFKKNKDLVLFSLMISTVLLIIGFLQTLFLFLGIILFILPYLYIYSKSVDETCMIKNVKTNKLTEGDWLYKNVRIGKKIIKANWNGLTRSEINLLKKKHKYVLIREGIPFSPVFLISFLVLAYLFAFGLWNFIF